MAKITINNFKKMDSSNPEYSEKYQSYYINANPLYYNDTTGTQEQQEAPLAAALNFINVGTVEGNVVHIVPSTHNMYSAYAITDTTKVFGVTYAGVTSLGYPSGGSVNNTGCRLAVTANTVFAVWAITGSIYKMTQPSSGWTSCIGTISNNVGPHFMEPFRDFMAVSDSPGAPATPSQIRYLDINSFRILSGITKGIDLGAGYSVIGMKNLNNKYLAIAAAQGSLAGGFQGYAQNFIFLWDGISSLPNYSVKVPGKYIDMKVIENTLYVAVMDSISTTSIYKLSGTTLRQVVNPQISTIYSGAGGTSTVANPLFDYNGELGIHLDTSSLTSLGTVYHPLLIYDISNSGISSFVINTSNATESLAGKFLEQFTVGYDGTLFASQTFFGSNGSIQYYPLPGVGTYQQIAYISKWIKVHNATSLDVHYSTPPQSGSDKISVTVYGVGEDIISGSATYVLNDITPTNYVTSRRTRLDLKGFQGSWIKIILTTTNSTWQPIIRKLELSEQK